jgi:drug/metabolite transporter (DMT)-like permease
MRAMTEAFGRRFYDQPYALLALAALFWGGNAVASRIAIGQVSPMALTTLRWTITVAVLLVIARDQLRADWPVLRRRWRYLFAMGAIGLTAFNAIMYVAAYTTSGVNLTIIQGAIPVFVLMGAFLAYRTRISAAQGVGVVVTIAGIAIIASKGDLGTVLGLKFATGDLLMLVACACYAAYTVALQRRPNVSGLGLFATLAIVAGVMATPLYTAEFVTGHTYWPTPTGWAVILYVGLFPSLLSQIFYMRGIELIGPGRAGIFVNLVPVFGSALSVMILGEPFGWYQATALVLVLGGIAWAQRR